LNGRRTCCQDIRDGRSLVGAESSGKKQCKEKRKEHKAKLYLTQSMTKKTEAIPMAEFDKKISSYCVKQSLTTK
jgi:hypothetical protein